MLEFFLSWGIIGINRYFSPKATCNKINKKDYPL